MMGHLSWISEQAKGNSGKEPKNSKWRDGVLKLHQTIDFPAQFISNPNQTHLKQPIKVSRITWTLKAGVCD